VIETLLRGGVFGGDGTQFAAQRQRPRQDQGKARITEKSFLFLVHETPSSTFGASELSFFERHPQVSRHFCLALCSSPAMIGADSNP
jgi:hypothetical protein